VDISFLINKSGEASSEIKYERAGQIGHPAGTLQSGLVETHHDLNKELEY
jgi:hypothetical protein